MVKKQVERPLLVKRHVIALVITLLIFTIGILIGLRVSELRIGFTKDVIEEQQADYESLHMQLLYLTSLAEREEKRCTALINTLERNLYDLENSRVKLENYIESGEEEDFDLIKRDYMLTEIRYWLLAQEAREVCPDEIASILYFYERDAACDDCSTQGHILTYLKNLFGDKLLIFSLDVGFDEPMIKLLQESYGIETLPAVVVEGKPFEGLTRKEALIKELCLGYRVHSFETCGDVVGESENEQV